jgi:hypothetical protein
MTFEGICAPFGEIKRGDRVEEMILTDVFLADILTNCPKELFERYPECNRKAKFVFSCEAFLSKFLRIVGTRKASGTYGLYNTLSGRLYIGQGTSLWRRLRIGHLEKREKSNAYLQNALRKYGKSAFVIVIFDLLDYPVANKRAELCRLENDLIFNLGKIIPLYNLDLYIDRSLEDTQVFRKSPSQANIKASRATNTGVPKTELHKEKTKKEILSVGFGRPVSLTNLRTNEVFKFQCTSDAQHFLGITRKSTLTQVLNKRKTNIYKGKWKIADLMDTTSKVKLKDLQTNVIHEFPSLQQAMLYMGIKSPYIMREIARNNLYKDRYEVTVIDRNFAHDLSTKVSEVASVSEMVPLEGAPVSEILPSEEQDQVIKKQRLANLEALHIERHSKTKRYIRVTDMKSGQIYNLSTLAEVCTLVDKGNRCSIHRVMRRSNKAYRNRWRIERVEA